MLEVLRSGRLSLGPMGERFERELAAWLGVEDAVAVSSGTTALHLGVRALGWGPGDEVLTSPFSFVASANCLLYEGARPVFCDVDPVTLDLDPAAVEAARGERSAGILPVHIFGFPAAMPELEAIAARHGLGLLEDACEALGAVDSEGRRVGTRGNLATFAFYANKQMTTGEGGMIVPSDPEVAARLRAERNQGRAPDMGWLDHGGLGFNYRLSDVAAALGVAQVEKLDRLLERRAAVAALYEEGLAGVEGVDRAIRRARRRAAQLVRLRRPPRRRDRSRRHDRPARRAGDRLEGLPALHPPLPAPARARLARGAVPGRRSGFGALAGAAVLPRDRRVAGGPGVRGSRPIAPLRCHASAKSPTCASGASTARSSSTRGWPRTTSTSRRRTRAGCARSACSTTTSCSGSKPAWRMCASGSARRASPSRPPTRTSTWRSSACSARRSARWPASCTPGARATTRSRPTSRCSSRRTRCARSSWRGRRWSACSSWPRRTATGRCPATPTCSAPSRSTSATTCSPTSGCSPATRCASISPSTAPG